MKLERYFLRYYDNQTFFTKQDIMTIKEKLIESINNIEDLHVLNQLLELLQSLNISTSQPTSNINQILAFAGILNKEDTDDFLKVIDGEFNNIEGDWD